MLRPFIINQATQQSLRLHLLASSLLLVILTLSQGCTAKCAPGSVLQNGRCQRITNTAVSGTGEASGAQEAATSGAGAAPPDAKGPAATPLSGATGRSGLSSSGAGGESQVPSAASGGNASPGSGNASPASGNASPGSGGEGAGSLMCLATELDCDGKCVPNDSRNCGVCGHDCTLLPNLTGSVTCSADGKCEFDASACAAGWANCSMDLELGCETDINTAEHCGDCTTACSDGTPVCAGPDGCSSGCPDSTPTLCGTACVDVMTDTQHCGACDSLCTGGMMCSSGSCACPQGTHDCNGTCSDDNALATCGTECSACRTNVRGGQPICKDAQCSYMCPAPSKDCDSTCVDTSNDDNNCGSCGNRCSGGKGCSSGRCVCPFGTNDCGGTCKDSTSRDACGPLCVRCPTPTSGSGVATCNGISCDISCNGGTKCGNACVNTTNDTKNCGGCNQACETGQYCANGQCSCGVDAHLCDGRCRSNSDLSSCGGRCDPCPGSSNGFGTPTCTNTTGTYLCGLSCPPDAPVDCGGACQSFCG